MRVVMRRPVCAMAAVQSRIRGVVCIVICIVCSGVGVVVFYDASNGCLNNVRHIRRLPAKWKGHANLPTDWRRGRHFRQRRLR